MEFSFMTKIRGTKEKIWEYYADIEKWYIWESDLNDITLTGPFETGSVGSMQLEGMPPMDFLLTSVKEYQEFWDKTETPMGSICFGHEIFEESDGTSAVKHTVKLDCEEITAENINFLKQVFSDVPDAILLLKNQVEQL